jgi:hypothetical protein
LKRQEGRKESYLNCSKDTSSRSALPRWSATADVRLGQQLGKGAKGTGAKGTVYGGKGPGRGGSCPPPLPQIRTCAINASGSSRHGFAKPPRYPLTLRLPALRAQSPYPVAFQRSRNEASPSLRRVRAAGVPLLQRYYETLRLPVILLAAPGCAWLGDTTACVCVRVSLRPDAGLGPGALGLAAPDQIAVEKAGSPRFLENPVVPMPCSSTPAGPDTPRLFGVPMLPPCCPRRRLQRVGLSGLNRTALARAVYASSGPLLVKTQDSLPAAG